MEKDLRRQGSTALLDRPEAPAPGYAGREALPARYDVKDVIAGLEQNLGAYCQPGGE